MVFVFVGLFFMGWGNESRERDRVGCDVVRGWGGDVSWGSFFEGEGGRWFWGFVFFSSGGI